MCCTGVDFTGRVGLATCFVARFGEAGRACARAMRVEEWGRGCNLPTVARAAAGLAGALAPVLPFDPKSCVAMTAVTAARASTASTPRVAHARPPRRRRLRTWTYRQHPAAGRCRSADDGRVRGEERREPEPDHDEEHERHLDERERVVEEHRRESSRHAGDRGDQEPSSGRVLSRSRGETPDEAREQPHEGERPEHAHLQQDPEPLVVQDRPVPPRATGRECRDPGAVALAEERVGVELMVERRPERREAAAADARVCLLRDEPALR